ncbi:MAG: peptide ABC transporter substrate-binding protein [Syntrophus sp. (in: bacteria)]|nr:peptide ABC transporter substrate-binding protein [Syntrophus sp. (in: bacteria)]
MGKVLSVSELKKYYEVRKTAFSYKKDIIRAVDGVSFDLEEGQTLGVVGESGSGKSTLARCLLLLEEPDEGKIIFLGQDLRELGRKELKTLRKDMQIIFQDPYSSLNPRRKVCDIMAEPLLFHGVVERKAVKEKVTEILSDVGLGEDFLNKYPHEMSGGQRQRVAIGRALATKPVLIVADEPVSSLDVSIQAQIVNLFIDIREKLGISMVFVSHDLNIVRFISDTIIVMYAGKVLEAGTRDEVFYKPMHPYTQMLIHSINGERFKSPDDGGFIMTGGCVYCPRCDRRGEMCAQKSPCLQGDEGHRVACFIVSGS